MINKTILRHTFRENIVQPVFLFAIFVEVLVLVLILAGVSVQYDNHVLVSVELFGAHMDESVLSMVRSLLTTVSGLVTTILMFLFIIGGSFSHVEMIRNPLTGITLTKPVSRSGLFLSKFLGLWALVVVVVTVFSILLWALVSVKTSGNAGNALLLVPLSLAAECGLIFSLSSLLAMAIENSMGVAILSLGIYFYLGPLLGHDQAGVSLLVKVISVIVPPFGTLARETRALLLSGQVHPGEYVRAVPYVALMMTAGIFLFRRKDLG